MPQQFGQQQAGAGQKGQDGQQLNPQGFPQHPQGFMPPQAGGQGYPQHPGMGQFGGWQQPGGEDNQQQHGFGQPPFQGQPPQGFMNPQFGGQGQFMPQQPQQFGAPPQQQQLGVPPAAQPTPPGPPSSELLNNINTEQQPEGKQIEITPETAEVDSTTVAPKTQAPAASLYGDNNANNIHWQPKALIINTTAIQAFCISLYQR